MALPNPSVAEVVAVSGRDAVSSKWQEIWSAWNKQVEVCFSPILRSPELTQIIMDIFDYLEFIYLPVLPRLAPAQDLEIGTAALYSAVSAGYHLGPPCPLH